MARAARRRLRTARPAGTGRGLASPRAASRARRAGPAGTSQGMERLDLANRDTGSRDPANRDTGSQAPATRDTGSRLPVNGRVTGRQHPSPA